MFAIIGLICFVVAAFLKLANAHLDTVAWLVIIGGVAYGIEFLFGYMGWHSPLRRRVN